MLRPEIESGEEGNAVWPQFSARFEQCRARGQGVSDHRINSYVAVVAEVQIVIDLAPWDQLPVAESLVDAGIPARFPDL